MEDIHSNPLYFHICSSGQQSITTMMGSTDQEKTNEGITAEEEHIL